MTKRGVPPALALLFALGAAFTSCLAAPENPDTRPRGPDGGYLCDYVSPGVKACCEGGAGCTGGLYCNATSCACEDIEAPCGYSGGDAGPVIGPTPDAGQVPAGAVGPDGGTVDRLWFATTGDTRPGTCDATANYPRAAISQIAKAMKAMRVQFTVDLGDHMYVCNGSATEAQTQMGYYTDALAGGPSTWFMTMGNHECGHTVPSGNGAYGCYGTSADANYDTYMSALGRPKPYYSVDVHTGSGLARLVVIADDSWNSAQKAWLEATLADADTKAKYTLIARHHPVVGTRMGNSEILSAIEAHKYSLILTAHDHQYSHGVDHGGRAAVIGIGGAGSSAPGFVTVLQQTDGTLQATLRDASGNPLGLPWSVAPQ